VRRSGLPRRMIPVPNWVVGILPRSHSKSMRFCGQRNGLVFRLLQSHLLRARPDEAPASPIGWDSGS